MRLGRVGGVLLVTGAIVDVIAGGNPSRRQKPRLPVEH
jgi:hypothetical protein